MSRALGSQIGVRGSVIDGPWEILDLGPWTDFTDCQRFYFCFFVVWGNSLFDSPLNFFSELSFDFNFNMKECY